MRAGLVSTFLSLVSSFSSSSSSSRALPLSSCFTPFLVLHSFPPASPSFSCFAPFLQLCHAISSFLIISISFLVVLASSESMRASHCCFSELSFRVHLLDECVASASSVALSFVSDWDLFGPCYSTWASSIHPWHCLFLTDGNMPSTVSSHSPRLILGVFIESGPV